MTAAIEVWNENNAGMMQMWKDTLIASDNRDKRNMRLVWGLVVIIALLAGTRVAELAGITGGP